jgi:hypothetical protein
VSEKETILTSFTVLIYHVPWMKDVIPETIEDRDLLKNMEYFVSISVNGLQ